MRRTMMNGLILMVLGLLLLPAYALQPADSKVDLNQATEAELDELPGIGPAIAGRIIEYRDENGDFKKVEDLMNVKGIGEKKFLQLKELVTVDAPAAPPASTAQEPR